MIGIKPRCIHVQRDVCLVFPSSLAAVHLLSQRLHLNKLISSFRTNYLLFKTDYNDIVALLTIIASSARELLTEDFFVASCCRFCCSSSIQCNRSSIFCFSSLNLSISSCQHQTNIKQNSNYARVIKTVKENDYKACCC